MTEETELLRRYAAERSEAAFSELVRRHLGLVYSVALRQVAGDTHLAEDVVQRVFTDLARKAAALAERPALSGWLYRSTHFAASDAVRVERRRRAREQEAHTMHEDSPAASNEVDWERVRPTLDAAIAELDERDRDAVALRFFDGRPFAEIGARLRLTENAARMKVERALDKLQAALARRGITSTSAALGVALANQAGAVAPAGLVASVTSAALVGAAGGGGAVVAGFLGFMSTTKIGVAVAVVAIGVGMMQYRASREERMREASAQDELRAKLRETERRVAAASKRADAAEADNTKLLQAIDAARPAVGDTQMAQAPDGTQWLSTDKLANRGKAAPRAAFETLYWAQHRGDAGAVAEVIALPEKVRREVEGILATLPAAKRAEFRDTQHFVAALMAGIGAGKPVSLQIVGEETGATRYPSGYSLAEVYGLDATSASDSTYRTMRSKLPLRDGQVSEQTSLWQQTPDGWRMVIPPTQFVTGLWKRQQQRMAEGTQSPAK